MNTEAPNEADKGQSPSKWQSVGSRLPLNLSIILAAGILGMSIIVASLINTGSPTKLLGRWFLAQNLSGQFASQLQSQLGSRSYPMLGNTEKCKNVVIESYELSPDERTIDIKFHVMWDLGDRTWTSCSLDRINSSQYESNTFDLGIEGTPKPKFHILTQ